MNNLRKDIYFGLWLSGSIVFRPVARQKHLGGRVWWKRVTHLIAARKKKRSNRKGPGSGYTHQRYTSSDPFPPSF
jgi:hypothetical protein